MKQSLDCPGQALRVLEVVVSRIFRHSTHEIGKVSPTHQPPLSPPLTLPQEIPLVLISARGLVDPRAILQPEGLSQ